MHNIIVATICDWASENGPSWHKLHIIIKNLTSWVPYNIFMRRKL